ncbi:MAG: hypothetical protein AB7E47_09685 [Desulfovibrionaceae bacterium]
MPFTHVVCPHCGGETRIVVPTYQDASGQTKEKEVRRIIEDVHHAELFKTTIRAACPHCAQPFGVLFS